MDKNSKVPWSAGIKQQQDIKNKQTELITLQTKCSQIETELTTMQAEYDKIVNEIKTLEESESVTPLTVPDKCVGCQQRKSRICQKCEEWVCMTHPCAKNALWCGVLDSEPIIFHYKNNGKKCFTWCCGQHY
jgi:hypothetical protein